MRASAATLPASRRPSRIIAAASIGNALEWFDLLLYGYLALTVSRLFFPSDDEAISLLLAFAAFGVSYIVRPLGALVLGTYADRNGRKASLTLSIALMLIGTLVMAIVPTYAAIGVAAPIIVVAARLLQGFSVGGEFAGSTTFLVEHGADRKGFFASFQWAGQGLATVLASLAGVSLTTLLTPAELSSWGWRLPYVVGLLIGPIGLYIRRHADETPEFVASGPPKEPVLRSLLPEWPRILLAIGMTIASTSSIYLLLYMPTYASRQLHLPQSAGFIATLLGGLILTFGAPLVGHWTDSIGRTRIMLAAAAGFVLTAYPAFRVLAVAPSVPVLIGVACWLSFLKTLYSGALPSLMTELFPTRVRATAIALSYNVSVVIFGGFAPAIATALIRATGDQLAPAYYLTVAAAVSVCALWAVRRRLGAR